MLALAMSRGMGGVAATLRGWRMRWLYNRHKLSLPKMQVHAEVKQDEMELFSFPPLTLPDELATFVLPMWQKHPMRCPAWQNRVQDKVRCYLIRL